MYIRISADGAVTLSAPKRMSEARIEVFLKEKSDWIRKKLAERAGRGDSESGSSLRDGCPLPFLGQTRILRRIRSDQNEVRFFDDPFEIRLFLKDPTDDALARRVYEKGKRLFLSDLFRAIVDRWMPVFEKRGVKRPEIRIRSMRSLWGSCLYNKGKITLNERLIEKEGSAIEYVVLHELTHFLYPAHDKRFYGFLSELMPDHKERKKKLMNHNPHP